MSCSSAQELYAREAPGRMSSSSKSSANALKKSASTFTMRRRAGAVKSWVYDATLQVSLPCICTPHPPLRQPRAAVSAEPRSSRTREKASRQSWSPFHSTKLPAGWGEENVRWRPRQRKS